MKRRFSVRRMTFATVFGIVPILLVLWFVGIPPLRAAPPSLSVIQGMSELASTRVHISDVIEGENHHWKGKWTLHGEVILGVNLSEVDYVRADAEKREAVLRLPQPRLISSKVDHERSEEMYMKSLSLTGFSDPKVLRDEVWRQADHKIQRLGQEPGYAERAKAQAERVLQQLFQGVGWKVQCQWAG